MAAEPGADALHTDHYMGGAAKKKRRRKGGAVDTEALQKLEDLVFKRDIPEAKREQLAKEGKALRGSDGHVSYPIETAQDVKAAAVLARSGHGDVGAAKALISRRAKALGIANPLAGATEKAEEPADEWSADVSLWKGEREGKVYGVVLAPDREDVQKDVLAAEDIEKACHEFMVLSRQADVQHDGSVVKADLIENYIAPCDFVVKMADGTEETVTAGSWVQAWQVHDPVLKQEIEEGKRTGFSIAGTGVRTPIAA
jgi:hypothetical protein